MFEGETWLSTESIENRRKKFNAIFFSQEIEPKKKKSSENMKHSMIIRTMVQEEKSIVSKRKVFLQFSFRRSALENYLVGLQMFSVCCPLLKTRKATIVCKSCISLTCKRSFYMCFCVINFFFLFRNGNFYISTVNFFCKKLFFCLWFWLNQMKTF